MSSYSSIQYGSDQIGSVYHGSDLVWSKTPSLAGSPMIEGFSTAPEQQTQTQEMGWSFELAVPATAVGFRLYYPVTRSIVMTLWDNNTQAVLATKSIDAIAGEWAEVAIDTPVALDAYGGGSYPIVTAGLFENYGIAPADLILNTNVTYLQSRYTATHGNFPATSTNTYLWGIPDLLLTF